MALVSVRPCEGHRLSFAKRSARPPLLWWRAMSRFTRSERPFPWERDVTVCIAAVCRFEDDQRGFVLCADRKVGNDLGSADVMLKIRALPNGWRCLTAGTKPEIDALLRLYRPLFRDTANLQPDTIDRTMKRAQEQRKLALADEYVQSRFAISFDEFNRYGKERLPPELHFDARQEIGHLSLKTELILVGFINGLPELYYSDERGKVRATDDFAAVGAGAALAESALLRRSQTNITRLEQTIYNVYEAKRYAQSNSNVGERMTLLIHRPDGKTFTPAKGITAQLESLYTDYGPKPFPPDYKFPQSLFDKEWIKNEAK